MATRYWIAALPVQSADGDSVAAAKTALWARLQDSISRHSFDTPLYRVSSPPFPPLPRSPVLTPPASPAYAVHRPGSPPRHARLPPRPQRRPRQGAIPVPIPAPTSPPPPLPLIPAVSVGALQSNIFIEGVSHKIRRQIEDLERAGGAESGTLTVDGVPVDSYLTRFVWDEGKYPVNAPLKETVASIQSQVAKIEDDMKVRVAEYSNVKSQLGAISRKQTGSLAVRDLSNLIKPEDMVTSEHLVTLLSIVPKYSQKDWLASYESLDTFVVPRSSKKLHEDNEYALYTVTLFAKVVDNFKVHAREKGFQIRDFEYSPEAQESRKQELEKLLQDQELMRADLLHWCFASYSEVFSSWMHFSAVRVFVESILRYGLPARFLSVVLAPSTKSEKKVRNILEGLCGNANSSYWRSEDDVGVAAGLGGETESHPYVSFTINLV
ncbi:unnamed protein product [Alopecurus aequalis]